VKLEISSRVPQPRVAVDDQLRLTNILLATDLSEGSKRALDYAVAIASRYKAKLHLYHCVDPRPYNISQPEAIGLAGELARTEIESAARELQRQHHSLELETQVTAGDISSLLPQAIEHLHAELVVVGTHGRTGWKKMVLGSVAETIVRCVSCPVLCVGPSANRTGVQEFGPRNIMLAAEVGVRSQQAESFAFSLAHKYHAHLVIVEMLQESSGRLTAKVTRRRWQDSGLAGEADPGTVELEQLPNEVDSQSDLILGISQQTATDLLVLAVPATNPLTERLWSGESYRTVIGAQCEVLVVHAT